MKDSYTDKFPGKRFLPLHHSQDQVSFLAFRAEGVSSTLTPRAWFLEVSALDEGSLLDPSP
jgi:hypothetical protein